MKDQDNAVVSQLKLEPRLPNPKTEMPSSKKSETKWNTKNLGWRLAADLVSSLTAASLVAPLISIIDKSIMENASGRQTLKESLKSSLRQILLRPHTMLISKPVALIIMAYGGTYLTTNTLDTFTSTTQNKPATLVTTGTAKFAAGSATNIGLGVYKDQVYARMFGPTGAVARAVPLPSYALFTVRDCMTIWASFNVPPLLGPVLNAYLSEEVRKRVSGQTMAQFAAPALIQIFSTPIHLTGLDLYNRPSKGGVPSVKERWLQVKKNWLISAAARLCRIVPAFGIGGVVNVKLRRSLMDKLV